MTSLHNFSAVDIDGREQPLARYAGRVALVVNVASRCGFTPQYAGLESLWRRYRDRGLVVLGFPCDQFGRQEPGDEAEIKAFCSATYDVTFPLFAKISVNGPDAHPLYRWLKAAAPGVLGTPAIKWNFTKFLLDRHGRPRRRYAPRTPPDRLEADIVTLLAEDADAVGTERTAES